MNPLLTTVLLLQGLLWLLQTAVGEGLLQLLHGRRISVVLHEAGAVGCSRVIGAMGRDGWG